MRCIYELAAPPARPLSRTAEAALAPRLGLVPGGGDVEEEVGRAGDGAGAGRRQVEHLARRDD